MTVNDTGMNALVEDLQAAQGELEDAVSRGLLEGQRSLLRVLKVELLGQINEVAEHVRKLRWLLHEIGEKESEEELVETLRVLHERGGVTFVEQVEAIVSAKLSEKQNRS